MTCASERPSISRRALARANPQTELMNRHTLIYGVGAVILNLDSSVNRTAVK